MKHITSCAANVAPAMIGKKNGCLKLIKDKNSKMLFVQYSQRKTLVAKNISPELNKVLKSVIKCIKANAKCERLCKQFCGDSNAAQVRLLLCSEVRWLLKGNCLVSFLTF